MKVVGDMSLSSEICVLTNRKLLASPKCELCCFLQPDHGSFLWACFDIGAFTEHFANFWLSKHHCVSVTSSFSAVVFPSLFHTHLSVEGGMHKFTGDDRWTFLHYCYNTYRLSYIETSHIPIVYFVIMKQQSIYILHFQKKKINLICFKLKEFYLILK